MCDLVAEAIDAGALGFSTSRTALHRVPDGRVVPGTHADPHELLAIAQVMGDRQRGVFEAAAGTRRARRGRRAPHAARGRDARRDQPPHRPAGDVRAQPDEEGPGHPHRRTRDRRAAERARRRPPARRPPLAGSGCSSAPPAGRRSTARRPGAPCATCRWPRSSRSCGTRSGGPSSIAAAEGLPTIPMTELYVLPEGDARYDLGAEAYAGGGGEASRCEPGRGVPPARRRA